MNFLRASENDFWVSTSSIVRAFLEGKACKLFFFAPFSLVLETSVVGKY